MTQNTDRTFCRTPTQAIMAAPESLAHVAVSDPRESQRAGLCHRGHAGRLERRYLNAPGLRSSRTCMPDAKPLTAHRRSAADAGTTA
jgi:hypothetical protein